MTRLLNYLTAGLCLCLSLQTIYTAYYGVWEPTIHRPIILAIGVVAAFLFNPLGGWTSRGWNLKSVLLALVDAALLAMILTAIYLFISVSDELENGFFTFPAWVHYAAFAGILALLELTRRVFGLPLFIIGLLSLLYVLFGDMLPGIFRHAGYDLGTAMEDIWFTTAGVFGLPLAILLNLVFMFIVFGAVLEGTGAGHALLRIATAATGRLRGGPAHAAIFASALFGTMSGSVIANVVGTGTMTIPMIKRRGFSPHFAGGVEAAASTGGQIMPPVMGVAAFMMAEFTGVPYLYLIIAAIVPALFYFGSLVIAVFFEAQRQGIEPVPVAERTRLTRSDLLYSLMFVAPVAAIIVALAMGRSPVFAGLVATATTVVFAFIHPEFRANPFRLVRSLIDAGRSCTAILVAVATLGLIIGAMDLTGLGIRFAQVINDFAADSLFLSLALTMAACLVLGMGMPTVPAYIIVVLVLGPAIAKLGVPMIVAHLFVFYYGVLSAVTPPVALAAFAAAPIAESNPMRTAVAAVKLTAVAFIVPFFFVYNPQILIIPQATGGDFDLPVFAWAVLRLAVATWIFTTATAGLEFDRLRPWERVLRAALSIAILGTMPVLQLGAIAAWVGLMLLRRLRGQTGESMSNA